VTLQTQGLQTLEQIRTFSEGSQALDFEVPRRESAYAFAHQQLERLGYGALGKGTRDWCVGTCAR